MYYFSETFIRSYRILPHYANHSPTDKVPAYKILKYRVHPNFTLDIAPYSAYDLAVILLDEKVAKTEILALPAAPLNPHSKVKMMSFGANSSNIFPKVMQEANLEVKSDAMCEGDLTWASFSPENNVCVSNNEGTVGCPSDAGAPLVWEGEPGVTYIVGVMSIGRCHQSKFTVFVHVQHHVAWIKKAMDELLA